MFDTLDPLLGAMYADIIRQRYPNPGDRERAWATLCAMAGVTPEGVAMLPPRRSDSQPRRPAH